MIGPWGMVLADLAAVVALLLALVGLGILAALVIAGLVERIRG